MAVHIATIGWDHPSRILPSLLESERPDRVFLVCSNNNVARKDKEVGATIGTYIRDRLNDLRIESSLVKIDPMDANAILRQLMALDLGEAKVHLNITGGTKIMVVAVMMYAMLSNRVEKVYYAKAENYGAPLKHARITADKLEDIPQEEFISWGFAGTVIIPNLGAVPRAEEKTTTDVLLRLQQRDYESVGELAREIADTKTASINTVRDRLSELRKANLITVDHQGKFARPRLSETGIRMAEMLRTKMDASAA